MFLKDSQRKLTSVRIPPKLFNSFKATILDTNYSLRRLVTVAIHLYLTDEKFRKEVHNINDKSFD